MRYNILMIWIVIIPLVIMWFIQKATSIFEKKWLQNSQYPIQYANYKMVKFTAYIFIAFMIQFYVGLPEGM